MKESSQDIAEQSTEDCALASENEKEAVMCYLYHLLESMFCHNDLRNFIASSEENREMIELAIDCATAMQNLVSRKYNIPIDSTALNETAGKDLHWSIQRTNLAQQLSQRLVALLANLSTDLTYVALSDGCTKTTCGGLLVSAKEYEQLLSKLACVTAKCPQQPLPKAFSDAEPSVGPQFLNALLARTKSGVMVPFML